MASSSSANCYVYQFDELIVLLDLGLSRKKIVEKLNENNIDLSMVNVILLTHEHTDHLKGADVLLKNVSCNVYTSQGTATKITTDYPLNYVKCGDLIKLNDEVALEVVRTAHDAHEPIGFIFHVDEKKIIHITDTGYILNENIEKFTNAYSYTIESNYEEEVLIVNDKYPFKVKQRILSEMGHLSNLDCHTFLKSNIGPETKFIQFAHLSENNNSPELVEQLNRSLNAPNKTVLLKDEIVVVNLCK